MELYNHEYNKSREKILKEPSKHIIFEKRCGGDIAVAEGTFDVSMYGA